MFSSLRRDIDPFGTVVLPVMLLLLRAPFLFGYAKPVPVNFRALRYPRVGTILVAAAGPVMNLLLAAIAALAFHIVSYVPAPGAQWLAANLKNALILNVIKADIRPRDQDVCFGPILLQMSVSALGH